MRLYQQRARQSSFCPALLFLNALCIPVRPTVKPENQSDIFSERELTFTFAIMSSSVRLSSVVSNVRAPYSGDWKFRKCFYAMWYRGHPWPLHENFTDIVPGKPLRWGMLNPRGVAEYSDFRPFEGYISETMQDMI